MKPQHWFMGIIGFGTDLLLLSPMIGNFDHSGENAVNVNPHTKITDKKANSDKIRISTGRIQKQNNKRQECRYEERAVEDRGMGRWLQA